MKVVLFLAVAGLFCGAFALSDCERERERKKPLIGAFHPTCDEKTGAYKVVQCREGRCFCGDALSGEVDGSTMRWSSEAQEMEAECLRNMTRCRKERYDAAQRPKLLGQSVSECDSNGQYKKGQCRESICYCVDEVSGRKINGTEVHVSDHSKDRCEKTECLAQTEVHNVPGKWKPRCDPDRGNFLPVQCKESVCYCVDRTSGEQISEEEHVGEVGQLHDTCMADCERLRDLGRKPARNAWLFTEKPRCEANGDYHNVQCNGTECSCVDKDGQPMRSAVEPMSQPIRKLNQLERQCKGGITDCKQRRWAYLWKGCPDECSFYSGMGEAAVNCCCD